MNKWVTDFFKPQESSLSETLNDIPNLVVNNENPSSSNVEKDRRQTVIAEGEHFRPTKSYKFPVKTGGDYDPPQLENELQLLPTNHFSSVFASRFPRNLLASSNIGERETSIVKKCLDDCSDCFDKWCYFSMQPLNNLFRRSKGSKP